MEYKIDRTNLREQYFFNETGDVYFYLPNSISGKAFISFKQQVREVRSNEPGKSTHYLVAGLRRMDNLTDWVEVADVIVRSAFKIPVETKGYVRHKNGKYRDLALENLEFVALHPVNERPYGVHDMNGTIPMEYLTEDKQTNQVYWDELPGAQELLEYVAKVKESRKESNLTERDRSLLSETLYILIEDRGFTAAEALDTLMLDDSVDALTLYIEGRERVYAISEETMAKVNQEREENKPVVVSGLSGNSVTMPSFKSGPQTYLYTEGETDVK